MAIPSHTQTHHHVGTVLEDIPMGIRAQDFSHVAFMFENLYERPIDAVVREYSTNAWDSHVMAGNPAPIEVTLPTEESLSLVIQDYGIGMSVDDVREIYANYGASDKRHTNEVAGMLGMGSKSALSYAPMFTVSAVKGGVKTVVMSTKDKHGLGVLKVKDTVSTDEPNGVCITIPVDRWDVDDFRAAATKLFQFWEPGTVLIDGEPPAIPAWCETALSLDAWDHTMLVRNDVGLHSSYVVMGNVPYPVEDADTGRFTRRFVARLNISDVDVAPSREGVRHSPHTDQTLAELDQYVKDNYRRALDAALISVGSRWEETMFRVLWQDRNVALRSTSGDPLWTYTPNTYGHRKARTHGSYPVNYLTQPNVVIVTGFTAKNVSTVARERLREFASDVVRPTFVLLPPGVPIGQLEGHPRIHAWDTIVGATTDPKPTKGTVKRAKHETLYATNGLPMTAEQLSKVKGKVLYLDPGMSIVPSLGDLAATVVSLRSSNQIARLKRYVPKIKTYEEEVTRLRRKAEAAITNEDRSIVKARTLPEVFHLLDPDDVLDDELADALRLRKRPDTKTMVAASTFGVTITPKGDMKHLMKRYPLLVGEGYYHSVRINKGNVDDLLLYINAKYDSLTDPALDVKAS